MNKNVSKFANSFQDEKKIRKKTKISWQLSDKYNKTKDCAEHDQFVTNIFRWKNGGKFMRIDAYTQVNQLYKTNKTKKDMKSGQKDSRDSLEISDFGSAYQVAKQAAEQGEPIRAERIKEIQAQMAAGTYNVSIEDVADKLADQLTAW